MTATLLPVLDVTTGLVALGAGCLAWWRRPSSRVGLLLVVVGGCWFAGSLVAPLAFLHRGPLVHLHVSYPTGRFHRPLAFLAGGLAYVAAVVEGLTPSPWLTAALALLVAGAAIDIYRRTSGRARKAGGPALVAALGFAGVLLASAVNVGMELQRDVVVAAAYDVVICLIALGLATDLLRGRWTEAAVADLLTQLRPDTDRAGLEAALRSALSDPTLVLGYWVAERAQYVDGSGEVVALDVGPDRSVTPVTEHGERHAVLVHSASVLEDPHLIEARQRSRPLVAGQRPHATGGPSAGGGARAGAASCRGGGRRTAPDPGTSDRRRRRRAPTQPGRPP